MSKVTLVDVFSAASQTDIDNIDATVADIRKKIAELEQTIAGLQTIRKALDVKINGKPPRQKREKKSVMPPMPGKPLGPVPTQRLVAAPVNRGSAGNGALTPGERIIAAIRSHGPMSKAQIADKLNMMSTTVGVAVSRTHALRESGGLVHIDTEFDDD